MTIQDRIDLRDRANQVALSFVGRTISTTDGSYDLLITVVQDAMKEWAEAEREACEQIAEKIRARELAKQKPNGIFYDTIAEEIRDRIKMRPATSNSDWPELSEARSEEKEIER